VGQLAASVGHEIRNPLGVISNSIYYLTMKLKEADDKVREHMAIVQSEVARANGIVTDLLDFSRVRPPSFQENDVNDILRDVLQAAQTPESVVVETGLDAELPPLRVDADQIRRVFLNLISNAIDAMPDGGKLAIDSQAEDDFAAVRVMDTGEGIPAEEAPHIFEPLVTTKIRGIGLGLAIVKGIVEGHRGSIDVESAVGEGTTFTVRLPIGDQRPKT